MQKDKQNPVDLDLDAANAMPGTPQLQTNNELSNHITYLRPGFYCGFMVYSMVLKVREEFNYQNKKNLI